MENPFAAFQICQICSVYEQRLESISGTCICHPEIIPKRIHSAKRIIELYQTVCPLTGEGLKPRDPRIESNVCPDQSLHKVFFITIRYASEKAKGPIRF